VVTSDGLKPYAAAQSPCVPPTCGCPLLRGHLRGPRGLCDRLLRGDEFTAAYVAEASASALADDGLQFNERQLGKDIAAAETRDAVKDVVLIEAVSILSDSVALKQGKSRMAAGESSTRPVVVMAVPAVSPSPVLPGQ